MDLEPDISKREKDVDKSLTPLGVIATPIPPQPPPAPKKRSSVKHRKKPGRRGIEEANAEEAEDRRKRVFHFRRILRMPIPQIADMLKVSLAVVRDDITWWTKQDQPVLTPDEVQKYIRQEIEIMENAAWQLHVSATKLPHGQSKTNALIAAVSVRERLARFLEMKGIVPREPIRLEAKVEVEHGISDSVQAMMLRAMKIQDQPLPLPHLEIMDGIDYGD